MTPDQIRDTILKAIFSEEGLVDVLVLKGGNALRYHGVTNRQSQDLDFSIKEEIRFTKEKEGKMLEEAIEEAFDRKGYIVNSFEFKDKPKKRKDTLPPFWGGYSITFTLLDKHKYQEKVAEKILNNENLKDLNKYAEPIADNDTKTIEIDLSFDEYTEHKVTKNLDGTTIYLYSPLMIVYEKVRASCQQLDEYPLTSSKIRARDLYDIYTTLTNNKFIDLREEVFNPENFPVLEKIFNLKDVPLELMTKLGSKKDELEYDYEDNVRPQIPGNEDSVHFDYLFSYNQELFNELYEEYINNKKQMTTR